VDTLSVEGQLTTSAVKNTVGNATVVGKLYGSGSTGWGGAAEPSSAAAPLPAPSLASVSLVAAASVDPCHTALVLCRTMLSEGRSSQENRPPLWPPLAAAAAATLTSGVPWAALPAGSPS
jgi:hypothetical protein